MNTAAEGMLNVSRETVIAAAGWLNRQGQCGSKTDASKDSQVIRAHCYGVLHSTDGALASITPMGFVENATCGCVQSGTGYHSSGA